MNATVEELLSCYDDLRKHLAKELRHADHVDDIAQTSFEKVYAQIIRQKDVQIESPRALLFHTAHNVIIDYFRQRKSQQKYIEEQSVQAEHSAEYAPSAETIVFYRELVHKVMAKLEELPARRRDVYILFRVHGYSRAEISQHLNISEATVAKHVVRATIDCASAFAEIYAMTGWSQSTAD